MSPGADSIHAPARHAPRGAASRGEMPGAVTSRGGFPLGANCCGPTPAAFRCPQRQATAPAFHTATASLRRRARGGWRRQLLLASAPPLAKLRAKRLGTRRVVAPAACEKRRSVNTRTVCRHNPPRRPRSGARSRSACDPFSARAAAHQAAGRHTAAAPATAASRFRFALAGKQLAAGQQKLAARGRRVALCDRIPARRIYRHVETVAMRLPQPAMQTRRNNIQHVVRRDKRQAVAQQHAQFLRRLRSRHRTSPSSLRAQHPEERESRHRRSAHRQPRRAMGRKTRLAPGR